MSRRGALDRVRPRTLRTQLVVTVAALLALAFLLAAVVSVVLVHRALLERLDSQLRAAGTRYAVALEHGDGDGDADDDQFGAVEGQAAGTLGARVTAGRVTAAAVVAGHEGTDQVTTGDRAALARLTATSRPRSVDLPHLGRYEVLVTPGKDGDLLITGLPYEPVRDSTDDLILADAVVFATVLGAAILVSTALVRVTLRPLRRVTDTAAEVAVMPMATGAVSLPARVPADSRGTEVQTLAAAFNAMLEQVESALRSRQGSEEKLRTFIADASHELRTPVTVVRSHAELAQRTGGDLPEPVRHALARIVDQAERMGRTVEELLLLARLDAGRPLDREDVDLSRVVLDAVDDARATAPGHRWLLRLPEDEVHVQGDATALHQVVTNLLTNARVHTPPGTTVLTSLRTDADAGVVHLVVGDDGPGIPPEVADRAFDRFVRADPARSGGGTGLGLPIVAALVGAQHGLVALEAGRGTRVRVTMPMPSGILEPSTASAEQA